jgi:hypothetical protein
MREMKMLKKATAVFSLALFCSASALKADQVTVENFDRAETDTYLYGLAEKGAFGRLNHERDYASADDQYVVRINLDTLYSFGVFDLSTPLTINKPDGNGRFQSLLVLDQDHYVVAIEHDPGMFQFTRQEVGTDYAMVVFRTFADPQDPSDIDKAHKLQDEVSFEQADQGSLELPEWDQKSLSEIRTALKILASNVTDTSNFFGNRGEIDRLDHYMGTAAGFGGNPKKAALYFSNPIPENDGLTPYKLTLKDVPAAAFWSVTVYNESGFLVPNKENKYSLNSVTAEASDDGSFEVHFGAGTEFTNNIPITDGWNYTLRVYQPIGAALDGSWNDPVPERME